MRELESLVERAEKLYSAVSPERNADDVEGIAISVIGKILSELKPESRAAVLFHFTERYPRLETKIISALVRDFGESFKDLSEKIEELQKETV